MPVTSRIRNQKNGSMTSTMASDAQAAYSPPSPLLKARENVARCPQEPRRHPAADDEGRNNIPPRQDRVIQVAG